MSTSRTDLHDSAPAAALGAVADSLPDPVAIVSTDAVLFAVNRAFLRLVSWTGTAAGRSLLECLDTPVDAVLSYLRHCGSTSQPMPGLLVARPGQGDPVPCRVEGWAIRPRTEEAPALIALRLVRKSDTTSEFLELTRRIGTLSAEIARRRRAEAEAQATLRDLLELQQRLATLTAATDTLLGKLTVGDVVSAIGSLATTLLPADAHAIWRFHERADTWKVEWQQGLSDTFVTEITNWSGSAASAVPFNVPLAVTDVSKIALLEERRTAYEAEGVQSLLVVPLRIHEANFGTVVAYFRRPAEFTHADLRVAAALGNMGSAALTTVDLYEAQSRSRAIAEVAEHRARFLAAAAAALASSLDYEETLRRIAQLAVPEIADWCAVDIADENGSLKRVATAHADPSKLEIAKALYERYPPRPDSAYGAYRVFRTGEPDLMRSISEEVVRTTAQDDDHFNMLRALGLRSYMCVPLVAHGRVMGVLTFVSAESQKEYSESDLRFAEEVAWRATLAVENARAYDEARRANQLKDEFLATLSHELRTPLNAILGYTRMLRTGAVAAEKQPLALETVERNAMALHQIVEDVLDVSRIVAGKVRLNVQTVFLPVVVQDAIATVSPAAAAKGVALESILDPAVPAVAGDPDRLQQVVWNLLANAVKFTPRGGRVQVRLEQVDSEVAIVVSDTGVGIPPDFLPHIFERFRQGESGLTREHGGLGLGLAITRHLVELHGGTVTATSGGEGQGSTFRIRLPIMIVHPDHAAVSERVHPRGALPTTASAPVASLDGIAVLAVDDDLDALTLMVEVLEAAGARVRTAGSAEAALQEVDRDPPDVIVSDLGMPGLDGCQFIARLRQSANAAARAIPAAALTAFARSEDRIKALQSGFQMHLSKPVSPAELVTAVRALVQRAGLAERS